MNSIEKAWKNFLNECLNNGEWVTKDDGDNILEIIDNHIFIQNIIQSVFGNQVIVSLDMFLNLIGEGKFNIKDYPIKDEALASYVKELDDCDHIFLEDDAFVYTYPERLFNVKQVKRDGKVLRENQVAIMLHRLKEYDGSNRAVANLYMCALDKNEQHIPCLNFVQALIRDNELCLHVLFRSNDLYGAFPGNMLFIQYLGLKIVDELKRDYPLLKFGGVYYNSTSLHIYKGDYEQAKKVIK